MIYTAVCSGHYAATAGEGRAHLFIDGERVQCPAEPTQIAMDVNRDGDVLVVAKSASPGDVFVVNKRGQFLRLTNSVHWPEIEARLDGRFLVAYVASATELARVIVAADLVGPAFELRPLPLNRIGTSQGVLSITHGVVRLTDDELYDPAGLPARLPTFKGVRFRYATRAGDLTVGQGQDVGGVIGYDHAADALYRISHRPTQHKPDVAVQPHQGEAGSDYLVAVSEGDGEFVPSSRFAPLETHPEDPPPPPPPIGEPVTDQTALVERLHREFPPAKTVDGAFRFTMRVALALEALGAGLFSKPDCGGENIASYDGKCYRASRIIFRDGRVVKVLTDVPTTNGPSWQDQGIEAENLQYRVDPLPLQDEPPVVTPPPTLPPDDAGLVQRVEELEAAVRIWSAAHDRLAEKQAALAAEIKTFTDQSARIAALEQYVKALKLDARLRILETCVDGEIESKGEIRPLGIRLNVTVKGKLPPRAVLT